MPKSDAANAHWKNNPLRSSHIYCPHLPADAGKPVGGRSANLAVRLNPPPAASPRGEES